MPLSFLLFLAVASVVPPPPADTTRLAIEGLAVGDPEGRLVTLMPSARCSRIEGDSGIADRWCRIPEQTVFGVLPESLTATLREDRIDTVIARMPRRAFPLLRARLTEAFGAPEQRTVPVLPAAIDSFEERPESVETLQWTRAGVLLRVAAGADGVPVLSVQAAAGTQPGADGE